MVEIKCTTPRGSLVPYHPGRVPGDNGVSWRVSVGSLMMPVLYSRDPSKTQSPKSVPAPRWANE